MVQQSRTVPARRDTERIRAEIERARAEIAASMLAIRDGVDRRLDWRHHVRRRPFLAVGVAFAIGWMLGRRGSTSNQERLR